MMELEKAMQHMDPMQVTDYLHKTLNFLKKNNNELCFPNISQNTEAFLVNLVTDTRNLKCKSFKGENRMLADEIIEVLELSRDVFRWAYSYENGRVNRNLLVYKKIYTNKIKNQKKYTLKPSSIAHRLIQQTKQNETGTLSTAFKLSFLNKTLRFIKNNDEVTLYYNEMPLAHAEYVQSLMQTPVGNDVGFGFKSLYAPLWEALEEQSVNFVMKMTLQATNDTGVAKLKLEKIPKKSKNVSRKEKETIESTENHIKNVKNDTHKEEEVSKNTQTRPKKDENKQLDKSLKTNTCATSFLRSTFTNDPKFQLLSEVSSEFIKDSVINLAQFVVEPSRASISFNGLTEHELSFVKRVKGWAASPEERNKFSPYFRDLLIMLNANIAQALKTCKITTTCNEKDRGITLKKTPLFTAPATVKQRPISAGTRSKSLTATKSRDRSVSKDRLIQFQTASSTTNIDSPKNKVNIPVDKPVERGRSTERRVLNKRKAKLLEDMSTPVESDRGMRMMLLMGWDGGALGSRGEGIIEPIIPPVDRAPKAGLGHIPPPKAHQRRPVEFRMTLLHNMYDLLLHDEIKKEILYKEPLTKKEKKFIPAAVQCFNGRHSAGLWDDEADLQRLVLQELCQRPNIDLKAEISQDFKTVTLMKVKNAVPWAPTNKQAKAQKQKKPKKNAIQTQTDENTDVLVTSYDIETEMQSVDTTTLDDTASIKAPKAGLGHIPPPKAHQRRPVEFRMTLLHNMYDLLLHDEIKKEILYKEPLTKKEKKFIPAAVQCFNGRHSAGLWDDEADLQRLVLQELCQRPNIDLKAEISQDFKTVTLMKVKNAVPWAPTNKQAKAQKQKKPKKNAIQTQTDENTDVLVTSYDIETEMQSVDTTTLDDTASIKAIRKRALRVLFLKKITEVLHWETEAEDIRFQANFTMQKALIAFICTVIKSLNDGVRYSNINLLGFEHHLYEDLRRLARPWQLSVEFQCSSNSSCFTLTKKPILKEDHILSYYGSVGPKVHENNNDEMTDNRNKVMYANKDNLKEVNTKDNECKVTKENGRSSVSNIAVTNKVRNIDNNENVHQNNKCNENILTEKNLNIEHDTSSSSSSSNLRDLARIHNENLIKSSDKIVEGEVPVKMEPECDNTVPYDTENDVVVNIKQEMEAFTDNVLVLDNAGLSDLDKDIQNLEMAICNADLAFDVKKETDCDRSNLELVLNKMGCDVKENGTDSLRDFDKEILEADLCFNVNTDNYIDTSVGSKRSRANLNSSQELDPKRSKICSDDREGIVILSPKNPDKKINSGIIREVQSVISDGIDKCNEFLPLLKCHGVQNGGLVYSCHDKDDVAWLKNVISVANLDLAIVTTDDLCLEQNRRIMAMKINSFWILEKKKTFSLLEKYNVGLDTKSWKVLATLKVSKTMKSTFYLFIVEVGEKSLKYISDENFSLYCGIDKAEFSIIL